VSVEQAPRPIFTGIYSYRRPSVAIAGSALTLILGGILARFVYAGIHRPPVGNDIWAGLFAVSILGFLFYCGCYLVVAYLRNHHLPLEITDDGVHYGAKFFPWGRVRWISGSIYHGRYHFVLGLRGFSADRHLMIDRGLSEEEYESLISVLEARLHASHPNLQIG
jgi:hypothetical protein